LVGLAREFLPLPPALPAPEAERRQGEGRADQPTRGRLPRSFRPDRQDRQDCLRRIPRRPLEYPQTPVELRTIAKRSPADSKPGVVKARVLKLGGEARFERPVP